ncbi:MAG: hypothetical protein DK303_000285 [Chloroflexi bacterium]|nr:MAG: hypothetical protein DK303_000285 [Chloroflexota bacterium]
MTKTKNIDIWTIRFKAIRELLPEATTFLVKSGVPESSDSLAMGVSMLWVDAADKDQLIFSALNDIQKNFLTENELDDIETVRGFEPFMSSDDLISSFYCLWTLVWDEFRGISVKLSTTSSGYSPVMSIKCHSEGSEIVLLTVDDDKIFLKCLGDCFLAETSVIR